MGRIPGRFGVTALLGLAVLAPVLVQNDYYIQLCTEILIASLLAISLNFLIGYTGLVSLGHAVYLGVGAYAFALLTKNVYPSMWAGLMVAGASCALLAWFMGVFCVRLAGLYFAMLTLAFSQVVYTVAYYWRDVTGGDDGMLGIPKPDIGIPGAFSISLESFTNFYYFVLIIVAALIFLWRGKSPTPLSAGCCRPSGRIPSAWSSSACPCTGTNCTHSSSQEPSVVSREAFTRLFRATFHRICFTGPNRARSF